MKDHILAIKDAVDKERAMGKSHLAKAELSNFRKGYDDLVAEGLSINPEQKKPAGKRGKAKQSKARNLLLRLQTYKDAYLRFASDFTVPFDNNQAERDFRLAKVKQKVSGSFRSSFGGQNFALIQSFLGTIRKHHISLYPEICKVFQGYYNFPFQLATE
jgi:transposase